MNERISQKLKELPREPGVYFHKNAAGEIIYIGKAARLSNRVRQYFQKSRARDPKTEALVEEIADVEWVTVETELDALFVEAELIRRYMPRYNILLRDDKSMTYIRINDKDAHPTVTLTRRPLDDGAKYFGPYFSALSLRKALKYLRRIFPFSTHTSAIPKRDCLQAHLGLCPGLESDPGKLKKYRDDLKKLMQYFKGERVALMREIERDMNKAAKEQDFEVAAKYRNQLYSLRSLTKQIVFGDRELLDISKDKGLTELTSILGLLKIPRRIEGYDISHMQGTDNVASMVVFVSGVPDKAAYRKFKLRIPGNDDFAHMNEAITRRLGEKNRKDWGMPDVFLIDGGKGQLSAAIKARDAAGIKTPMIGLAKREEEIVIHFEHSGVAFNRMAAQRMGAIVTESDDFALILLPKNSHVVKLLQRIRDESHRFAVSYHSVLKTKRQTASLLDDIPTIGPATRKKLLKTFGSVRGLIQARDFEVEKVVGEKKAAILKQYLRTYKRQEAQETP
ncbi:MAG: putative excinuclease subunit domain protein [Candidatus Saccharibacteria bacterium]|nr:putative excinuclease subunit domain protein [Candidatus Saccharibacteria bacterium]